MKKTIFTLIIFLFSIAAFSQLLITDGTDLYVEPGTTLYVTTGINSNNATIWNFGTIDLKGSLENNSGSLFDNSSSGTFKFSGTTAQEITGHHDAGFYGITEIDNAGGISVTSTLTGADQTINGELKFTNGKLTLNEFNLLLGAVEPTGFSADNYVVTDNSGELLREVPGDGVTMIHFPVGNSAYNPVILQNNPTATTDTYGVRVEDEEPAGLSTPHFVDRRWIITEEVPEGSGLTVIPQWNSMEELTPFNRDLSAVGLVTGVGPVYDWKTFGTALGDDPYYREGAEFTDVGTFAIGDRTSTEDPGSYNLKDSQANLLAGGTLQYYDVEWKQATEVSDGKFEFDTDETSVHLRMYYEGGMQQVDNVIVADGYVFYTALVSVELLDSDGAGLSGGEAQYHFDDWIIFGTTDGSGQVNKELLPVTYSFKMYYEGAKQQIDDQNVSTDPIVNFATIAVIVELLDDEGDGIPGGEAEYKAQGWNDFGTTDEDGQTTKELLPVMYSFKMYYNGDKQKIKKHNTGENPLVTFYESGFKSAIIHGGDSENVEFTVYPNPFKTSTTIAFTIPETKKTILTIYNARGVAVSTLFEAVAEAGHDYKFDFNGYRLPNGIYLVHLQSGHKVSLFKKIILSK